MIENRKDIVRLGTTILFEGLFKGKPCYGIGRERNEKVAVFEHDEKILAELVAICPKVRFSSRDNVMLSNDNGLDMPLSKYLYCLYYGVDTSKTDALAIYHDLRNESGIEDCRKANLWKGSAEVEYDVNNNCMVISSNKNGFIDVVEPDAILIAILQSGKIQFNWRTENGRMWFRVRETGRTFSLGDLAYLSYHGFDGEALTVENYIRLLYRLNDYKVQNRMEIEHLDSNYHNHLAYNIVLVGKDKNREKNNLMERIKEPYCIKIVYDNGVYKIAEGVLNSETDKIDCELIAKTEHFETVVDLLKMYQEDLPERVIKRSEDITNVGLFSMLNFGRALANSSDSGFVNLDAEEWSQYIRRKQA